MEKSRLWTKDFITGTLTNFFLMLNYYLLVVIMSSFAMETFDAPPSQAGFSASIFLIGALAARMHCGRCIEHIGRKKLLIIGMVSSLIISLLYLVIFNIWALYAVRLIHGVAYGTASTAIGTIVAGSIPADRRGEGLGYYMLSNTLATAIGPFLGMVITRHGSYHGIFWTCAAAAVLSLLNAWALSVPEISVENKPVIEVKRFRLSDFFESKAIPISIVSASLYFCYSSVLAFLSPYSKEIMLTESASFFYLVFAFAIFFSRPFTGRLFDTKGENITMYPAFFVFMAGLLFLSQAHSGVFMLLAGACTGFAIGVIQSCGLAIAVKVTPKERIGRTNSTYFVIMDLAVAIGPIVLGLFIPMMGYRGVYVAMAVGGVLCALLYYLLHGKNASARQKGQTPV